MKLPKKYKGHGLHIWCNKRNKVVTKNPYPENYERYLRYQSRIWTGKPYNKFIIRTWEEKDIETVFTFHQEYKKDLKDRNFNQDEYKPTRKSFPSLFSDSFNMWLDFLNDVDVPEHEKKNLGDPYVKARARHGKLFKDKIGNKTVYEINPNHVGEFSKVIPGKSRNYNDHMDTMKWFYNWLIKYGYEVENPFENVTLKRTKKEPVVLSGEDLRKLLRIISPENGWSKNKLKRIQRYSYWVPQAFKLALLTGGRLEEVTLLQWKDVKFNEKVLMVFKGKESKGELILDRPVPITVDLLELLSEIGPKEPEDYIIAPERSNRDTVRSLMSKAFTHFWRQTGINKAATFHSLRKTYITRLEGIQIGITKFLNVHTNDRTTVNHYIGKEEAVRSLSEHRLFEFRNV